MEVLQQSSTGVASLSSPRDAHVSREAAEQDPAASMSTSPTPKATALPQQVTQLTPPPRSSLLAARRPNDQVIVGSASQESVASDFSMGGISSIATAPGLQSSSSNLSTSTIPETQFTSPASSVGLRQSQEGFNAQREAAMAAAAQLNNIQSFPLAEHRTPSLATQTEGGPVVTSGENATSPMAIDSPYLNQASKRTASGTVKSTTTGSSSPPNASQLGRSQTPSAADGSNKVKIAELSSQLKTRLSYAMVKVQNGWERRSIEDLENHISSPANSSNSRRTPMTPTPANIGHSSRPSTSSIGTTTRNYDAPYSSKSQRYAHSPDASTRHSPLGPSPALLRRTISSSSGEGPSSNSPRTYASFWANHGSTTVPTSSAMRTHAHTSSTSTVASTAPSLAPAADLVPSSTRNGRSGSTSHSRRTNGNRAPPALMTANRKVPGGSPSGSQMITSPTTPTSGPGGLGVTPRRGPLRMPSQQAEKDAVDTLLFMSSPNNSSNMKNGPGGSPLRSEFPAGIPR